MPNLPSLFTGAAHGIGRATAIALAKKGMPLGLIDRDGVGLAELAKMLKDDGATAIATAQVDVTDREALFAAVDRLSAAARTNRCSASRARASAH